MNTNTVTIPTALHDASAGMVLAEELRDAHNTVLLPQGATLTEAILAALRRRGIELVPIAGVREAADVAARRELKLKRLDHLFRKCTDVDVASAKLKQQLAAYLGGGKP